MSSPDAPHSPDPRRSPDALRRELRWRRLDVRMLFVHPVQEAVRFLPALLVVFISGRGSDRSAWWDVGALGLVVVFGMSRWFTTSYRVGAGHIEVRTGLLRRVRLAAPTDRVRTVDVTASVWHRLLGLARVEIGTGGGPLGERLVLDALAASEAQRLRADLLHRGTATQPGEAGPEPEPAGADPVGAAGAVAVPDGEVELLRLDPKWVRYAPLTTSGLLSALAVYGFVVQYSVDVLQSLSGWIDRLVELGVVVALLVGLVVSLVGMSVLAVSGYLLAFWQLRLSRHPGGTLHVSRGLLTTRATSLEEARMRGVELGEPLGLRLAGAARLTSITTGLGRGTAESGATVLAPPAPVRLVTEVAVAVCADPEAVHGRLHQHGPVARRRRYTRAILSGAGITLGTAVATVWWQLPTGLFVVGCLPLLAAPLLAADRYAGLGHLLTPGHLVVRAGSFERHRAVLARAGVIGVVVRQSFFQRRAGVATLTVTTAAGRQAYHVVDAPLPRAWALAAALLPGCVGDFLAPVADSRAGRRGITVPPVADAH